MADIVGQSFPSNLLLGSLWNFLQCYLILFLSYGTSAENGHANFSNIRFCSSVYIVNTFICFIYFKMVCVKEESIQLSTKCGLFLPIIFHSTSVLFGAPYFSNWDSTLSFALLLTSLILPTVATNSLLSGKDTQFMRFKWMQSDELCKLGGAWLSAVFIPLDWDRPWQVWPVPCCIGAIVGCIVSAGYRIMIAAYQLYWPSNFLYINSVSETKKR